MRSLKKSSNEEVLDRLPTNGIAYGSKDLNGCPGSLNNKELQKEVKRLQGLLDEVRWWQSNRGVTGGGESLAAPFFKNIITFSICKPKPPNLASSPEIYVGMSWYDMLPWQLHRRPRHRPSLTLVDGVDRLLNFTLLVQTYKT